MILFGLLARRLQLLFNLGDVLVCKAEERGVGQVFLFRQVLFSSERGLRLRGLTLPLLDVTGLGTIAVLLVHIRP